MVSSVLSPEKVIGRQNTNKAAAQNFISGDSVLGSSVAKSAANKIVGFQRAGVQPAAPNVNNVVNTISTNINNNVTSTINKTIQGFSADYQKRIKQVDDAKPLGILGKFLNVYKTALGFINFFGNKRNIDRVRDNLDALKKSFIESFEVAKLIRQVIIKIVKQLSNLPVASPSGGGGLNLDVDIPGGPLRKTAPRNVNRMRGGGGRMLALGAGALGLGALGAGTVNALSDSPQDQAQAAQTTPDIPGDVVDKFSSIVDRFANVISKLFNMKNEKSKGSSGSAGGGGRSGSPGSPGSPPPGGSMGAMEPIASGSADEKLAAYASALEGTSGQNAADAMQVMLNRSAQNHSGYGGLGEQVMARAQFTPMSSAIYGPTGHDPAADAAYGHIAPMLGKTPEERKAKIRQIVETEGFEGLDKLFKKKHAGNANEILADFKSGGPMSQTAVQGVQGRVYFKGQTHLPKKGTGDFYRGTGGNFFHGSSSGKIGTLQPAASGVGGIDLPDYMLSPQKREELKLSATNVSQPPPSQQQQQPVVMPINLGGGGQQQSGGGSSGGGGGSQGSGPSVPFLPTSNPDNFLVLYSRMVYNIVDG
jgi:hypothetical protein